MSIVGSIKVIDVPDDATLTTVKDLLVSLERFLAVEIDAEQITNVYVGNQEPDTTDRQVIWVRMDNSGNFVGLFVFIQGTWLQMLPPPNGIFRVFGRSDELPPGYALADENIVGISHTMDAALKGTWYPSAPLDGIYFIFDVVYVGL